MAKLSGTDLAGFEAQLKTTRMFYTPADALAFTTGPDLPKIMDLVRTFSFEHDLLGEGVKSKDAIGIATPAAASATNNIKLRFDPPTCRWPPTVSSDAAATAVLTVIPAKADPTRRVAICDDRWSPVANAL